MEKYVAAVSSYARDIDNLIYLVTIICGFWFFLAIGVFFWLIFRFKAKDGVKAMYIEGTEKKYTRFITIPHLLVLVCDVVIIVAAVKVWVDVKINLPPPDRVVRVIAQQWAWTFQDAGLDNKLDTDDDVKTLDVMHVEVNKVYNFELVSKDVLHSFSIPVFRLKQDTIPGRVIKGWFKAEVTGQYDIQCVEMCGLGHGIMAGRVHIETAEGHAAWLASTRPAPAVVAPPPPVEPTPAPTPAPAAPTPPPTPAQ